MPLILNQKMPVYQMLHSECPALLAQEGSYRKEDVHHVLLFNLMTDKIGTELQYLRCLGTARQYIQVEFLRQVTYRSKRQDEEYLQRFYLTPEDIRLRHFDGMVITGAPLEHISCEDTLYWEEFCQVLEWSKTNVHCLFAGCWGAFASVHRDYNVEKTNLSQKLSGIFQLNCFVPDEPLFTDCPRPLCVPLSRATDMDLDAVNGCEDLVLLASAPNGSPVYLKSKDNRSFYCTGHPEYELDRLAFEYERDRTLQKAWRIDMPLNYFTNDDPTLQPKDSWTESGKQLFRNWMEYYVDKKTAINR